MLENNQKKLLLLEDLGITFFNEKSTKKRRYGLYKCYCGNEFKAQTSHIKSGHTKSCGCYKKEKLKSLSGLINTTHKLSKHRLYNTWKLMINRCNNPKSDNYSFYGGLGVSVCDRWLNVANFIEDMYPTFQEGLTLDRVDGSKGYYKDNCRWSTKQVQSRNTRKIISSNTSGYRGVTYRKDTNKWRCQIIVNKEHISLGSFKTALEAGKAYDKYVIDNKLEHTINGV